MKNKVIYPGTFDPITKGHVELVYRALKLFDSVVIAVGTGDNKNPLFSVEERIALIKQVFPKKLNKKILVERFNGLLADFAKAKKITAILRGLRVVSDFDYEFQMASMNRKLEAQLETIFLMPADQYMYISSSLVRTIARCHGSVDAFVPPTVARAIQKKFKLMPLYTLKERQI